MLRMIFVTLAVFALTGIIWAALKQWGANRVHVKPQHAFVALPFQVIAHRGGSLEAPENTLAAFDNATKLDPEIMLELDVHKTKDDKLVVFHDSTLARTTDGTGRIEDLLLEELKKFDAGYRFQSEQGEFSFRGKGIRIPTLEEVLVRYPKTRIIIEIKSNFTGVGEAVVAEVLKANAGLRVVIASEHLRMVNEARRMIAPNPFKNMPMTGANPVPATQPSGMPSVQPSEMSPQEMPPSIFGMRDSSTGPGPHWAFGATYDEMYRTLFLLNIGLVSVDKMRADVLAIPEESNGRKIYSKELLAEAHKRFKKMFLWTINEKTDMERLLGDGVDGIITDRPSLLLEVVKNRKNAPRSAGR